MKAMGVLVVVVLVAAVCGQEAARCADSISAKCPADDPASPLFLPDPEDCQGYCECSGGVAYHLMCGPNTAWNAENNTCDWVDNVDCGDRPYNPDPHPTDSPTE